MYDDPPVTDADTPAVQVSQLPAASRPRVVLQLQDGLSNPAEIGLAV